MWDAIAVGIAVGLLAQLTAGRRTAEGEAGTVDRVTFAEHRIDGFAVGLVVGLLSSLPTILQTPSQSLGPGMLAAFAAFTMLGTEPTRPHSTSARAVLWVLRGVVGALAILAGWVVGSRV